MGAPIAATLVMLLDRRRRRGGAYSLLLLLPHNNCVVETWRKLASLGELDGEQRGPKGGRSGAPVSGVASVIAY